MPYLAKGGPLAKAFNKIYGGVPFGTETRWQLARSETRAEGMWWGRFEKKNWGHGTRDPRRRDCFFRAALKTRIIGDKTGGEPFWRLGVWVEKNVASRGVSKTCWEKKKIGQKGAGEGPNPRAEGKKGEGIFAAWGLPLIKRDRALVGVLGQKTEPFRKRLPGNIMKRPN